MKISQRADIAISRMIRVFLIAEFIHLGQIFWGMYWAMNDWPTQVGFPFEFAGWGSFCFQRCSHFWPMHLVATVVFWVLTASAWAWWGVRRRKLGQIESFDSGVAGP